MHESRRVSGSRDSESRAVRSYWALSLLVLVVALACEQPSRPVRVVLITLDTLRYDSLAGTGGQSTTMPRLASWAATAARFERFYTATASTQPTHASMFTGLYPWQHGVVRNGMRLAETDRTVAEKLRAAGFATSAVVASFPVSRRFGFGRGFERFHDEFATGRVSIGEWLGSPVDNFYSLAETVTAQALAELDAVVAERQFFWFHFFDPHSPYGDTAQATTSPEEVLAMAARGEETAGAVAQARRLYDVDVSYLDAALGRLLERLAEDESRFETHVVIVSDHGESFGEEGSMAHGRRLIPSQLHVPCLIRSPRFEPGARFDVAGSIDVAATLLALAGVQGDLGGSRAGRDLTQPVQRPPRIFGMRRTWEEPFRDQRLDGSVEEIDGYLFYYVDERGVLVRGNKDSLMGPAVQESGLSPEEAQSLRQVFGGFEQQLFRNRSEVDTAPGVRETLEALGYVD